MPTLLFWLAVPLLAAPWLVGSRRRGAAIGQLVTAGVGLAAFVQGAGTLDPRDLHSIASTSPHDALFVGITAGWLIAGACLLPDVRNWKRVLAALPLMVVLLYVALPHLFPLAVGLAVGALPPLVARLTVVRAPTGTASDAATLAPSADVDFPGLAVGAGVILISVVGPGALAMVGLALLIWREWWRSRGSGQSIRPPVLEIVASLLLVAWTWMAVTITGTPLPSFLAMAQDAPISPAAAETLALLALGWAVAIAAPWPLDRMARVTVQLPVAAVVVHLAGAHVTMDGLAHWQPLLTTLLVASALGAAVWQRWDGAVAAMVLLGATRRGILPLAGAIVLALAPLTRPIRIAAPWRDTVAGVAVALVLAGLLRDEVLLAVVLALGITTLANRADRVVARVSGSVHL